MHIMRNQCKEGVKALRRSKYGLTAFNYDVIGQIKKNSVIGNHNNEHCKKIESLQQTQIFLSLYLHNQMS